MFGILRAILALAVVVAHLIVWDYPSGIYAVFGFYALSGYLMTTIMQTQYGYSAQGIGRFALNRFLRLYPVYLAAIGLSLGMLYWIGEDLVRGYHDAIFFPRNIPEVLRNLGIFFLPYYSMPRLSPATWALTVELVFYLGIALGLSRTKRITAWWLGLSLGYTIYLVATGEGYENRYFSVPAAALPFAIGSMLHHLKADGSLDRWARRLPPLAWCYLALALNLFIATKLGVHLTAGFYMNLVLVTVTIVVCIQDPVRSPRLRRWDKRIGTLSYPIYVIHWQIGLIVSFLVFGQPVRGMSTEGLLALAASVPVVIAVAAGLHWLVERPVEKLRSKVRRPEPPSPQ